MSRQGRFLLLASGMLASGIAGMAVPRYHDPSFEWSQTEHVRNCD